MSAVVIPTAEGGEDLMGPEISVAEDKGGAEVEEPLSVDADEFGAELSRARSRISSRVA